jgi:hypothetical protein
VHFAFEVSDMQTQAQLCVAYSMAGKTFSSGINDKECVTDFSVNFTSYGGHRQLGLKKETNLIHDNGASVSLMSKEIADAIGLHGETKPLGLNTIGVSQVQQAFKAQINIHDAEGMEIGKAWVNVISEFVQLKAVDWSSQAAKFPHLSSINFPKPFIGGKCHILLGNDNHHLSVPKQNIITAPENSQSMPYASLTQLGWCAAGPTLPPVSNDPVINLMVRKEEKKCHADYRSGIKKGQVEAEKGKN